MLQGHRLLALAGTLLLVGLCAGPAEASDPTAWVANEQAGTIEPVDLATGSIGTPIAVGSQPVAIAITPDGATAYVADYGSSTIVPVKLATGTVRTPIALGDRPDAIAITPDGTVAYAISDNGTIWPITVATGHVGNPSRIPTNSDAIAIGPDGRYAYITNVADGTISQLSLPPGSLGQQINLSFSTPDAIAITPDGSTAWVASNLGGTITPINLASGAAGTAVQAGQQPTAIALTADGGTAYVTNAGSGSITPIDLATGVSGTAINVGGDPSAIALEPSGAAVPTPGGGGSTGGGSGGGDSGAPPVTIGNQRLTVTLSPPTSTTEIGSTSGSGSAQLCHAPGSVLRATVTRKMLPHGARLALKYVRFTLGKQARRATRLPATARFSLKGLRAGVHTLTVRAFFNEKLAASASGRGRHSKLTVTVSKRLTTRFRVC